jgi:hypothetical protein
MRNGMFYLGLSSPSKVWPYPLYIEIGQVHGGLGDVSMVYMRQSPGGSCSGALWTVAVSWSRRSLGRHPAALF